ncbi:hypothetical protein Efla_004868 [Eimeria flavescens]
MDSQDQFERLTAFVFRELLDVTAKQGDRDVSLAVFQELARTRRAAELKALSQASSKKKNQKEEKNQKEKAEPPSFPGLTEAELRELQVCFSLLDPECTSLCAVNDLVQILTCLGEPLSHRDVQQLMLLEKLEGKSFLTFTEFAKLCARL